MVVGTSEGFAKDLQLIGVGYRGAVSGNTLTMNLGFSHPVVMTIPHDVEVKVAVNLYSFYGQQVHAQSQTHILANYTLLSRHSLQSSTVSLHMSLQVLDCSCMHRCYVLPQLGPTALGVVGLSVLLWVTAEITALLPFEANICSSSDQSKLYPCLTSAYGFALPETVLLCCR